MRISQENVDELNSILMDIEEVVSDLRSACDTWLDGEEAPDYRADARAEIEDGIGGLESNAVALLSLLSPGLRAKGARP